MWGRTLSRVRLDPVATWTSARFVRVLARSEQLCEFHVGHVRAVHLAVGRRPGKGDNPIANGELSASFSESAVRARANKYDTFKIPLPLFDEPIEPLCSRPEEQAHSATRALLSL